MLSQHIQFLLCRKKLNSSWIKHRIPWGCRVSNWDFSHTRQRESWSELVLIYHWFFFVFIYNFWKRNAKCFCLWYQVVHLEHSFEDRFENPSSCGNHWIPFLPCATKLYLLVLFQDISEWDLGFLKGLFRCMFQEKNFGYGFGKLNGRFKILLEKSLLK